MKNKQHHGLGCFPTHKPTGLVVDAQTQTDLSSVIEIFLKSEITVPHKC